METILDFLSCRNHPRQLRLSRTEAVEYVRSWKGTPLVQDARVRGGGCDCRTIVEAYLIEIGAAIDIRTAHHAMDWFRHTRVEKYFNELSHYARPIWQGQCRAILPPPPAMPGDIAIFRVVGSHVYNHGCIITEWPRAIHAFHHDRGVSESRPALHALTAYADMAIFDPWSVPEC